MRDAMQRKHDEHSPYCKGTIQLDETETVSSDGFTVVGLGPWFCGSCDWEEGKRRAECEAQTP